MKLDETDFRKIRRIGSSVIAKIYEVELKNKSKFTLAPGKNDENILKYALKLIPIDVCKQSNKINDVLMEKHALIKLNRESYKDHETRHVYHTAIDMDTSDYVFPPSAKDHVIKLYHSFRGQNTLGLVFELAEAGELFDFIRAYGISDERVASNVIRQISLGVAYVHANNITHRDIKCENFVCAISNPASPPSQRIVTIKLIDFGSAVDHTLSEDTIPFICTKGTNKITKIESFHGSPNFIDRLLVKPNVKKKISGINDVWSLGCTIYQVLTGYAPFVAQNELITYLRILARDIDVPCYMGLKFVRMLESIFSTDEDRISAIGLYELVKDAHEPLLYPSLKRTMLERLMVRMSSFYIENLTQSICNHLNGLWPNPDDMNSNEPPQNGNDNIRSSYRIPSEIQKNANEVMNKTVDSCDNSIESTLEGIQRSREMLPSWHPDTGSESESLNEFTDFEENQRRLLKDICCDCTNCRSRGTYLLEGGDCLPDCMLLLSSQMLTQLFDCNTLIRPLGYSDNVANGILSLWIQKLAFNVEEKLFKSWFECVLRGLTEQSELVSINTLALEQTLSRNSLVLDSLARSSAAKALGIFDTDYVVRCIMSAYTRHVFAAMLEINISGRSDGYSAHMIQKWLINKNGSHESVDT